MIVPLFFNKRQKENIEFERRIMGINLLKLKEAIESSSNVGNVVILQEAYREMYLHSQLSFCRTKEAKEFMTNLVELQFEIQDSLDDIEKMRLLRESRKMLNLLQKEEKKGNIR